MNQDVSHAADGSPIQARKARPGFGRCLFVGLANYLYVAENRILQCLRLHESCFARTDKACYAVTPLKHVVQVKPVVLQSGVASRRIASRTYQCRDFSVPM